MRLLALFIVVPLLELFLLLKLAEWTSGGFTFALVLVTGVVGATLARRQGWGVVSQLQDEMNRGELPTTTLVDALMIFVAGALLITPGIVTDLFGFSLLIPPVRAFYRAILFKWFREHVTVVTSAGPRMQRGFDDGNTVDAEVVARKENNHDLDRIEGGGPTG